MGKSSESLDAIIASEPLLADCKKSTRVVAISHFTKLRNLTRGEGYTQIMVSGSEGESIIDPICEGAFVIEPQQ